LVLLIVNKSLKFLVSINVDEQMAYSFDFRRKVLDVRSQRGLSIKKTAALFSIGLSSIKRWLNRVERITHHQHHGTKIDMEGLQRDVEHYPDAYQYERAARLNASRSGIGEALTRLGVSYKKNANASQSRRRKKSGVSKETGDLSSSRTSHYSLG
jgi:transposase